MSFNIQLFSQSPKLTPKTEDWSSLFPEIPNCVREIQPITQHGKTITQSANYYQKSQLENEKKPSYAGCGSISFWVQPSARKSARERSKTSFPSFLPFKIKNFDAYGDGPSCGVDFWLGSIEVYFDKDKVLRVSANHGAKPIMDFANDADYDLIKRSMNKLVKKRNRKKPK